MFSQVYTVALLAVFAQSAFAATCSRTYKIVAGDYCDKISQAQNVSTYQLAATNPSLINQGCTNLMPDETICLGLAGEDCSTTHTVQPGDTCEDIAAMHGLNMTILQLNNPQLDSVCGIYTGEVLCVSQTVQVSAIPSNGITVGMGGPTPSSTIIPLKTTVPNKAVAIVAPSPTPTASTPQATGSGDSEDDLPWCD